MVVVSFNDMGLKSLHLTRVFSAFYFKTKIKKKDSFSLIFYFGKSILIKLPATDVIPK